MNVSLEKFLSERRSAIVAKWFEKTIEVFPQDTSPFLRNRESRFRNPLGHTLSKGIEGLFDELLSGGGDHEKLSSILDTIIRINAVQEIPPSQAVAFIFSLKNVIREDLKKEIREERLYDELSAFESGIDAMALLSFDLYMKCREKIYDLRVKELKQWGLRPVESR
ncbi:MAG TPA: RsbRD N-terminal domain-containing protein [Thermodesulfovibrionales bacterium]|nr:RsbRD N-terminal domain-containing protein [Thermodesulfovibrionales bacterium]